MGMDFVAYDTETTGITPDKDMIIEIGAVRFIDSKPVKGWSTLVNPGIPIPKDSIEVHGIQDKDVAGAPTIDKVLKPFTDFCGDLTLVAHNAKFDFRFLERFYKEFNEEAPTGATLDTFALSKKIYTSLNNHRLSTLVEYLGIPNSTFHRAEQDAEYCGHVFAQIIDVLERNKELTDVISLARFSERPVMKFPQSKPDPDANQGFLF